MDGISSLRSWKQPKNFIKTEFITIVFASKCNTWFYRTVFPPNIIWHDVPKTKQEYIYHHVPEDAGDKIQFQVSLYDVRAELI